MAEGLVAYKPAPPERRALRRLAFRDGDGLRAHATFDGGEGVFSVWDLSAHGIALVGPGEGGPLPELGARVALRVRTPDGHLALSGHVVRRGRDARGRARVGLALALAGASASPEPPTLPLGREHALVATLARPFVFGQRVAVELVRAGAERLSLRCDDPSVVFVPGLPLALDVRGARVEARVVGVAASRADTLVDVAVPRLDRRAALVVAEHAFATAGRTPRAVRAAGLPTRPIRRLFECREVKTHAEYLAVLALRHATYLTARKLPAGTTVAAAASPRDGAGRILTFHHRGRLVGTVALRFPSDDDPVESVERGTGGVYPSDLPPKRSIVEVTKLCVDPEYRGGELMIAICEQICRVLVSSDRTSFVAAADRTLRARYEFVTYRATGHHYFRTRDGYAQARTGPDDERLDVLVCRPFRFGAFGLHGDPLRWNLFLRDVTDHARRAGVLRYGRLEAAILSGYAALEPLAHVVERYFVR